MDQEKLILGRPRAAKRARLAALVDMRRKKKKQRIYGKQGERLNGHEYKKLFQNAKQRVASDNEPDSANKDSSISSEDDSGFETMVKLCEPYVNKLRDYWHKRQNAVIFDGQDRLHKVIFFVLSLLHNERKPILILAASNTLSMWEAFLKWSKLTNVITYNGIKDAREFLRALESYSEKPSTKVLVILSSPDIFVEDMELFDHIKWELILIDECQRAVVATHFQKLKMLVADMKLLTVTGEMVDVRQSYNNILSFLDSKYTETHADGDMKTNDNAHTLKERLSPYIAFKCNFAAREFKEYWVPVQLSYMQIEQYCSLLESNKELLSSSLKSNTSLHEILIQTRKCCDHPYLVDPTLRNSSKKDVTVDPMDADINLSGKLQLLDKLLLEIKRCSLRVLVLFQPGVSSKNISTGDMLDDLVYRRFGEDSYIRIGNFRDAIEKRREALNMFNNVNSKKFVCLLDYHACHFCLKISRVDVAILFNSDVNPLSDIKSIQKVTIGPRHEPLKIFRLYSSFTIEEKALIFSKQGTTVDRNISYNNCQRLLAWGASYLYSKLRSYSNSKAPSSDQSFIEDLVQEFSYVLQNKSGFTSPSNRSIISNAQLNNGRYPKGILLFGETEVHTKESASVHECLMGNGPLVFWSNLFKESQHRQKNSCSQSSRRVLKSPHEWCSSCKSQPKTLVNNNEKALPAWKRKAKRTKREKRDKAEQSKMPADIVHTEVPAQVSGHQSSEMSSNLDQEEVLKESLSFNLAEPPNTSSMQHNEQPIAPPSACIAGSVSSTSRTFQVQQCKNNQRPLWEHVTKLEKLGGAGAWKFSCNLCGETRQGSYPRVKAHLLGIKGYGISICKSATAGQKQEMKQLEEAYEKKKAESNAKEVALPCEAGVGFNEQPIAPPSASIAGSVSSTSRPIQVQQCQDNQLPQHNEQPTEPPPSTNIAGSVSSTSRPIQVQQCQSNQPPQHNEQPIAPSSASIAGSVSSTSRSIQVQQCQKNQPPQHNEQPTEQPPSTSIARSVSSTSRPIQVQQCQNNQPPQHNEQLIEPPPSASIAGSVSSTSRPIQVQQCENNQPPQHNEQPIVPPSTSIAGSVSSTSRPIQVQQCQINKPPQQNERPIAPLSASMAGSVSSTSRPIQVQQCQNNRPPHTPTSTVFAIEIGKNQKERDKFTKSHQDKKSMLLSVCEEEISRVREKYNFLIYESEMCFTKQMQILEEHHKLVNAHKLLAEFMAQHCQHTNYSINNIL